MLGESRSQMIRRLHFAVSFAGIFLPLTSWSEPACSHAFFERSEPRVGSEVLEPPKKIVVYFDSEIEYAFSGFVVTNSQGKEVVRSGAQDESEEPIKLSLEPPALPPGEYRVIWSVIARDGHHTEGDFTFRVR
jgi:methionine-rich copper-binding protein CopC